MSEDLKYPIGKYETKTFSEEQKKKWLNDIIYLPSELETSIQNLDEAQLLVPYREGGWNIKQVVHHVADSHINAYCRFKIGLTEDKPTIRPYEEQEWALLDDVNKVPLNVSITLLHALHLRWHATIETLDDRAWMRTVFHPASNREMTLWNLLGMYAWHGRHHTAHIKHLRERMGW